MGDGPVAVPPNELEVAAFESDLAREADLERELAVADTDCFEVIVDDYLRIEQEYFAELDG